MGLRIALLVKWPNPMANLKDSSSTWSKLACNVALTFKRLMSTIVDVPHR